jgi:hypothetical protein
MPTEKAIAYAAVLASITDFYREQRRQRQHALSELIPALARQVRNSRERNRLDSHNLNVFRFFSPGETTHSRLLAFFLNPQAAHGQGTLFLTEFLRLLGIRNCSDEKAHPWVVTAETGRVDVLLRRAHPHSVVVIENKSNYALDQPNQLYRYWHQQIYLPQLAQHRPAAELADPPKDRYRLLYLSPASWKQVEMHSLSKPLQGKEWGAELPPVVPMGIVEQQVFDDLVVQWLTNAVALLPVCNHRLREFTLQYLQFWQSS